MTTINLKPTPACREEDPELFFPPSSGSAGYLQTEEARRVCFRCPLLLDCANGALTTGERHGVWGGLSERQRRRIVQQLPEGATWDELSEAQQRSVLTTVWSTREPRPRLSPAAAAAA